MVIGKVSICVLVAVILFEMSDALNHDVVVKLDTLDLSESHLEILHNDNEKTIMVTPKQVDDDATTIMVTPKQVDDDATTIMVTPKQVDDDATTIMVTNEAPAFSCYGLQCVCCRPFKLPPHLTTSVHYCLTITYSPETKKAVVEVETPNQPILMKKLDLTVSEPIEICDEDYPTICLVLYDFRVAPETFTGCAKIRVDSQLPYAPACFDMTLPEVDTSPSVY